MSKKIKNVAKRIIDGDPRLVEIALAQAIDLKDIKAKIDKVNSQISALDRPRSTVIQTATNEIVVKLFNGQKIYLDLTDLSVTPHLALDGIWEHEITRAWCSMLKPESVVLDIGANFGYYGLIASQLINMKKSKVVYFEPNPNLIPLIKKTLSVNGLVAGSKIENLAISDNTGTAKLSILKDYIGSSSLHTIDHLRGYLEDSMYLEESSVIEVPTTTIDSYCIENNIKNVDLIKLDVEGFEELAYSGMRKTVKQSTSPVLFIEFTFNSYEKPKLFFETMKKDFGNLALIDDDGSFIDANRMTYKEVVGIRDDWIMLVFSKDTIVSK